MNRESNSSIPKLPAIIIFIVIAIFTVGYISFKFVTSPERLKNTFQNALAKSLNRNVVIDEAVLNVGRLVFKGISIDFRDDEDHPEEYTEYIKCSKVTIKFKILPLIKKKFVFKELVIKSPIINIVHVPKINPIMLFSKSVRGNTLNKNVYFQFKRLNLTGGIININIQDMPSISLRDLELDIQTANNEIIELKLKSMIKESVLEKIDIISEIDILKNSVRIVNMGIYGLGGKITVDGDVNEIFTDPLFDCRYSLTKTPYELFEKDLIIEKDPVFKGTIANNVKDLRINWNLDLSDCKLKYRNLYIKPDKEILRFRGGLINKYSYFDVNWFIMEIFGASISGTGTIDKTEKKVELNIIGEKIDLKKFVRHIGDVRKYIKKGILDIRGKFIYKDLKTVFKSKAVITELVLKNIIGLSALYEKITGEKKNSFIFDKVNINVFISDEIMKLNDLRAKGGDIEGWGKGFYKYDKEINFTLYPRIYGREIGFRIYGSTDNIKIGLK